VAFFIVTERGFYGLRGWARIFFVSGVKVGKIIRSTVLPARVCDRLSADLRFVLDAVCYIFCLCVFWRRIKNSKYFLMPINKNAVLRYNTLDKCFQNIGRKYTIDDLLEKVNEDLLYEAPDSSGIKLRQLREDIRFMRSESGYSAPIITINENGKHHYQYDDRSFSINRSPLNSTEVEQLKSAINVLNRFEGSPEFEWLNQLSVVLVDKLGLNDRQENKAIGFESNIDYSGYEYISKLFNNIVNKQTLKITNKPYNQEERTFIFHPHYLKQYNNRWFIFGLHAEKNNPTWNIPLDRIVNIENVSDKYIPSKIDWEDFFYDMIGVTKISEQVEKVELLFSNKQAQYILTKPLHPSQKSKKTDDGLLITLHLIVNFELEMRLLSYGERVKVISPINLKDKMKDRLKSAFEAY